MVLCRYFNHSTWIVLDYQYYEVCKGYWFLGRQSAPGRPRSLCNMGIIWPVSHLALSSQFLSTINRRYQQSMGISRPPPLNNLRFYKITHVLRIPLPTSSSRPQLQRSLNSLRDDKLTRAIPRTAWSSVDSLVFHVGQLSLTNQDRITAARNTLERLDIASSLGKVSPLYVTLRGLHSGVAGEQREYTHCLCSNVVFADDTGLMALRHLISHIRAAFKAEKLLVTTSFDTHSFVPSVTLMRTRYLKSDVLNTKSTLAYLNWSRFPLFHARDTYAAYNDTTWAKDIALERICISEQWLSDIFKGGTVTGEGYRKYSLCSISRISREDLRITRSRVKLC